MKLSKILRQKKQLIIAITAGSGVIISVIAAFKAGIKAKDVIETYRGESDKLKAYAATDGMTKEEYDEAKLRDDLRFARDMALILAPTALSVAFTGSMLAAGYKISIAKQAALTAAYTSSEIALRDFREKAAKIIGKEKVTEIHDEIMKDRVKDIDIPEEMRRPDFDPYDESNDLSKNEYPCFDEWSGRVFKSNRTKIERALVHASSKCQREMSVSLNYIYDELDPSGKWLPPSRGGNYLGFTTDDLDRGEIPVAFTIIEDDDYGPTLVMCLEPKTL